jgi:hypothetical protein
VAAAASMAVLAEVVMAVVSPEVAFAQAARISQVCEDLAGTAGATAMEVTGGRAMTDTNRVLRAV